MTLAAEPIASPADSGATTADAVNLDAIPDAVAAQSDTFTSSTGIVFKLSKVNNLTIVEAGKKLKAPKIPVMFIEDKGRDEENPNHPEYVDALRDFQMEQGMLLVNTYLAFGTKIISSALPDDKKPIDDTEWSDDLKETLDIDIPIKGKARYLRWLKFHLLGDEDMNALARAVMQFSGRVTQEDVATAEANFRPDESGNATEGLPAGSEVRPTDSV
jgi:hypothetical protein